MCSRTWPRSCPPPDRISRAIRPKEKALNPDDQILAVFDVPPDGPGSKIEHIERSIKDRLARKLAEVLKDGQTYAVRFVKHVEQHWPEDYPSFDPWTRISGRLSVKLVTIEPYQYRQPAAYELMPTFKLSLSAGQELWRRVKRRLLFWR